MEKTNSSGRTQRIKTILFLVLVLLLFAVPPQFGAYHLRVLTLGAIYVVAALGYNFVLGMTGQFAVSQAAFWAIGAYTSGLMATRFHLSFWLSLPAAMISAALITTLLGLVVVRWRGHYLAMVTLGIGVITTQVLSGWVDLTGGPRGLQKIPRPPDLEFLGLKVDFAVGDGYYYMAAFFAILTFLIAQRIRNSRVGDAFTAIRDNEIAAEASGIDAIHYKRLAFALSSVFAGLSGSLYAHYIGILVPAMAGMEETLKLLIMVVLGGSGIGSVALAAILVTGLPEWLRVLDQYRMMLYGGTLILILIFVPNGLPELGAAVAKMSTKTLSKFKARRATRSETMEAKEPTAYGRDS